MSQDNMEASAEEVTALEDLSIQALRKYAALYKITLNRDSTKEQIVEIIKAKRNSQDMAVIVEEGSSRPARGWTRIHVHRDPVPGAANNPVFVGANGYNVTIPRGIDVDVPDKVVSVLQDAVELRLVENFQALPGSPERWEYKKILSYPFSVLDRNPGPDPKPGYEAGKKAFMAPREAFRKLFGRWPSNKTNELIEAQKDGLLKIDVKSMMTDDARNRHAAGE